jgi:hypothetical protein
MHLLLYGRTPGKSTRIFACSSSRKRGGPWPRYSRLTWAHYANKDLNSTCDAVDPLASARERVQHHVGLATVHIDRH